MPRSLPISCYVYSRTATVNDHTAKKQPGCAGMLTDLYMKRTTILILMTALCCHIMPGAFGEGPQRTLSAFGREHNWVYHGTPQFATDDLGELADSVPTQVSYFDGLGRRVQTVDLANGSSHDALADFVEYDALGRVSRQYMTTVSGASGSFSDLDTLSKGYSRTGQCRRDYAFTSYSYEDAPSERLTETRRPGEAWHKAPHGSTVRYLYNTSSGSLACRAFSVRADSLVCGATAPSSTIRVTETTDEEGNISLLFTDQLGRKVLERFVPEVTDGGSSGAYLDTYYVYDARGRLRLTLPPDAAAQTGSKALFSAGEKLHLSDSRVRKHCTLYGYDAMNRVTSVRYPGREEMRTIYSPGGLALFASDGELDAAGKASYTVYDPLGRVAYSGVDILDREWGAIASDRALLLRRTGFRAKADSANAAGYLRTVPFETSDGLMQASYYDDYRFLSLYADRAADLVYRSEAGCDPRGDTPGSGFTTKGLPTGSAVRVLDPDGKPAGWIVTAIYYDRKGRPVQTRSTNHLGGSDSESLHLSFDGLTLLSVSRHSVVTATDSGEGVLKESTVTKSYAYNAFRQPVSVRMSVDGGEEAEILATRYDLLRRPSCTSALDGTVVTTLGYTPTGELESISNPSFSQTLFYEKRPDGTRGYLNGLVSGQIFSMTEADISGEPVLSGRERSLSGLWDYRYSGARLVEASYTELSRCSGVQLSAGDMEVFDSPDYSEVYTYSPSGNLLTLRRKGFTETVYGSGTLPHSTVRTHRFNLVDDLTLSYDGPMLQKVYDAVPDPSVSGATDFFDGIDKDTEYTYDLNGNMTSDLNKGITSITYNHLNLPVEVVYAGNNAVRYSYDASGRRLSAEYGIISWVIDGGGTVEPVNPGIGGGDGLGLLSTEGGAGGNGASPAAQAPSRVKRVKTFLVRSRRDYCGSCLYADGELERILTESGWYSPGGSYTATVNDHQGNLRSTLTKSYATPSASTDLVGGSGTVGTGDLVGDLGGAGGTIGSGGTIGIGGTIGGGTIGGGIVEPQKPRLRYANLTAYSPYGLPLADWQGEERYLYSGKELDRTGGLMLYDFHARQYDPQLGRFTSPDPLQGKYPSLNPYLYCAANPISLTDPTGCKIFLRGETAAKSWESGVSENLAAEPRCRGTRPRHTTKGLYRPFANMGRQCRGKATLKGCR